MSKIKVSWMKGINSYKQEQGTDFISMRTREIFHKIAHRNINSSTITMNFPNFILVLVVASTSRSSADNYGDGAEISSVKSSLRRRYAPDQYLQLIAMKKSKRDDSIPTVRAIFTSCLPR
jgi:hypothetical protein